MQKIITTAIISTLATVLLFVTLNPLDQYLYYNSFLEGQKAYEQQIKKDINNKGSFKLRSGNKIYTFKPTNVTTTEKSNSFLKDNKNQNGNS